MKTYIFNVPCSAQYEVFAEDEEQARKILEVGRDSRIFLSDLIDDDIVKTILEDEDYKKADLVEIEER